MNRHHRFAALAATGLLLGTTLGGCTTGRGAPRAEVAAGKAQVALEKGRTDAALAHAEAAVLSEPRNASYRAILANAYLEAGRFASARTAFDDALELGDTAPRTALGYALSSIGAGDNASALAVLEDWRSDLAPADLGLALALAGDVDGGVRLISDTIRSGQNSPKLRQNLAYAYALQGNWRAARLMAVQDLDPATADARILEWAQTISEQSGPRQVANLLGISIATDPGMPPQLGLSNNPSTEQLVAEAAAQASAVTESTVEAPQMATPPHAASAAPAATEARTAAPEPALTRELPPVQPTPVVARAAPSEPADSSAPAPLVPAMQMASAAIEFVSQPVVQNLLASRGSARSAAPARSASAASAAPQTLPASSIARKSADGSNLIQLGSFFSEAGARRSWDIYTQRYPELSDCRMVITQATVRGRHYYRVNAGGLQTADARDLCGRMSEKGQGCIRWTFANPLPGTTAESVRMAMR
ncbi:SPOR domain-containing protein [Erythrobacter sp. LQ02-29]|uniref:SPOR domain-containing protein n=1 Tax=Erythrobacter sp. LQ02-29 TaxID=2920384 RepID=UPI001F4D8FF7|nr:SPOR domain-containing protein [Erythrobacter sp. LQ02-29]MCP9222409.1 SPOR domain-containing protein [Erythrobacter sp. LQ02-29]